MGGCTPCVCVVCRGSVHVEGGSVHAVCVCVGGRACLWGCVHAECCV